MLVFVTGNKIYMVDRRITSVMVAQDARKGRRVLDRFGPSGGGNTLRPVCGCVIPVLGRVLRDGFETWSSRGVEVVIWDALRGCPCYPYILGEQGYMMES